MEFSSVTQEIDKKPRSDRKFAYNQRRVGSLASKECVGNTPYLGREVSIRRGFELYRQKPPELSKIKKLNMSLKNFPVRHYHNGEYYNNKSERHDTLTDLVEDEDLAKKLFYKKHITEIRVKGN